MKTRREFLKLGTVLTAGTLLVGACRGQAPQPLAESYSAGTDEPINIAFFGLGWMGMVDLDVFLNMRGVRIVVLCDPDSRCLKKAQKRLAEKGVPAAEEFADYKKAFANSQVRIDAAVIATPDHSHFAVAMEAVAHGKHIFVEKPLCRTVEETRVLSRAAVAAGVVTQMGNQGQGSQHIRSAREWIEAGILGEITEIHAWTNRPIWPQGMKAPAAEDPCPAGLDWDLWLGSSPRRPYSKAIAPFFWRGWVDYGTGALGDMALHVLNPANYIFDLGAPKFIEAESVGATRYAFPESSKITFTFPKTKSRGELKVVWFDGKKIPPRPRDLSPDVKFPNGIGGSIFYGTKNTMMLGSSGEYMRLLRGEDKVLASPPAKKYPRVRGNICRNWVEGIRAGTPPVSNFEYSAPFTEIILLGVIAQRLNRKLEWDAEHGKFLHDDEANSLLG